MLEFDWEDIKGDKHKEYYLGKFYISFLYYLGMLILNELLGNSVNAIKPSFNCPKPNTGWWMKDKSKEDIELEEIKRKESELMNQALLVLINFICSKLYFCYKLIIL